MDTYESRRKSRKRARERQAARRRREAMAKPFLSDSSAPDGGGTWKSRAILILRDVGWYIIHKPQVALALGGFVAVIFGMFVVTHLFSGRIFPNVWALGVNIGDMTVDEAQTALQEAWERQFQIELFVEGERAAVASPAELGMKIDAAQTAEAALGMGMAGIPFGYNTAPVTEVDYITAQTYLLDLWNQVTIAPFNAGYEWQDGEIVGIPGRSGRELDVVLTMERLTQDPVAVVMNRRLELLMSPVRPDVSDPSPYLDEVRALASQPVQLTAYDPFQDEKLAWATSQQDFTSWLEAGPSDLTLREETFMPFVDSLNASLRVTDESRYLDRDETMDILREAIINRETTVTLRVRHKPTTYQIVAGDSGYKISRKTGIPFFLINEANPGRDWNVLSIGDTINLPSRDLTLPEPVVPSKRIIVDLDRLVLTAYEDGQQVFNWRISIGRDAAPTSPGIYQILNHDELAVGSGAALCGSNNVCGQWKMYWFMGIYQVSPGLINGFHGAVELPNGAYLAGGNVGGRDTYGCVMSENNNAKALYDWAEVGTVVEIISSEFQPQSQLGRQMLDLPA